MLIRIQCVVYIEVRRTYKIVFYTNFFFCTNYDLAGVNVREVNQVIVCLRARTKMILNYLVYNHLLEEQLSHEMAGQIIIFSLTVL